MCALRWLCVCVCCGVCGVLFFCVCVHLVCGVGVVCVHVVLGVVCTCGVWCWCCVCTCGVGWCVWWCVWCGVVCGEAWHAENPPMCTFKTPPCVRSGRLRVYRQRARMSRPVTRQNCNHFAIDGIFHIRTAKRNRNEIEEQKKIRF